MLLNIWSTNLQANYLQPKLLGFLVFFDAQMLKSSIEDKKLVNIVYYYY